MKQRQLREAPPEGAVGWRVGVWCALVGVTQATGYNWLRQRRIRARRVAGSNVTLITTPPAEFVASQPEFQSGTNVYGARHPKARAAAVAAGREPAPQSAVERARERAGRQSAGATAS